MENWKIYRLYDFIEINPKVPLDKGDFYSFVEMKDLSGDQKTAFPSQIKLFKGGSRFKNGDTLFARITPCLENGKICQVKGLRDNVGFGSTEFLVFRGKKGISNTDFIYYLSQYEVVRKFAEQNMVGTSGRQRVSKEAFQNIEIKLPDLSTQTAIAEILSSLDDKIELNNEINKNLEALAQALFKHWFVDFEFPDENGQPYKSSGGEMVETEMGEVPIGWNIRTIEEVSSKVGMGPFGANIKVETFVESGMPILSGQHLKNTLVEDSRFNYIALEHADKLKNSIVRAGDVIFTHAGNIGQVSYLPPTSRYKEYILSQRQFFCRPNLQYISGLFITLFFKSTEGQHRLLSNASSTGVPSISRPVSNLRNIKLVVPSPIFLFKFTKVVSDIYLTVSSNLHENNKITELRDTLLPKLISGELRVKEAIKQTEKVL